MLYDKAIIQNEVTEVFIMFQYTVGASVTIKTSAVISFLFYVY